MFQFGCEILPPSGMCNVGWHLFLQPIPACIPLLCATFVRASTSSCIPACWLVQVGIPGWWWQLPAVVVQPDAQGLSHGAFPPPRGIDENFQKWPKTCILISTAASPAIVLPLRSYCSGGMDIYVY